MPQSERPPPSYTEPLAHRLGVDADRRAYVLEAEEPARVVGREPALDAIDQGAASRQRLGLDEGSREGAAPFEVRQRLLEDGQRKLLRRAAEAGWRAVEVPHRALMVACCGSLRR